MLIVPPAVSANAPEISLKPIVKNKTVMPISSKSRADKPRTASAIVYCEAIFGDIDGLHANAITLAAEVIEAKIKPSKPTGQIAQTAFGETPAAIDRGQVRQSILALGQQDTDPCGLLPPASSKVMGASSDHLILETDGEILPVGKEVTFQLNYSALVRSMTSPFVAKIMNADSKL